MTTEARIPLFPLGVVVLPEMLLPLHIFEERYKLMIGECIAEDKPFGIVLFDSESIRSVGCTTRVHEVTKSYADGRMDILTRGEKRFVIHALVEERAYMEAQVSFFEDKRESPDDTLAESVAEAHRLLKRMAAMMSTPAPEALLALEDPADLSFAIAALEGFTPAERQQFLEMTSAHDRLRKSVQALAHLLERIQLNREIKRLIGGNGHGLSEIIK
ncbi:MAG: LON peptidase substrate-binding domain-containing protein [Desulfobacterales bacterium]|nr:LON peptidase substrate-binding domain-containing protein [Desulfobacterales bacterium]